MDMNTTEARAASGGDALDQDMGERRMVHWGRYYGALYRQTQRFMKEIYADSGLNYSEAIVLVFVLERPGTSQEAISAELSLDKAACARTLKSLEVAGFIHRAVNEDNRRAKQVYAEPKAERFQHLMAFAIKAFNERILEPIEEGERVDFLRKLHLVSKKANSIDYASLAHEMRVAFDTAYESGELKDPLSDQ